MGTLRPCRPADFAALALLVKELFDYHRRLQGAELLSREEAEGTARYWCQQPETEVLLYEEAGEVVAAARLRWEQDCPFLEDLVVRAGRRGQGLGTATLAALEAHVQERGADALFLSRVWLGNRAALDFYLRRGYDLLNTIELRKDFSADRRGRPVRLLGRTLYLAANVPEESDR